MEHDDLRVIEWILKMKPDADAVVTDGSSSCGGRSAMHFACAGWRHDKGERVNLLLRYGFNANGSVLSLFAGRETPLTILMRCQGFSADMSPTLRDAVFALIDAGARRPHNQHRWLFELFDARDRCTNAMVTFMLAWKYRAKNKAKGGATFEWLTRDTARLVCKYIWATRFDPIWIRRRSARKREKVKR